MWSDKRNRVSWCHGFTDVKDMAERRHDILRSKTNLKIWTKYGEWVGQIAWGHRWVNQRNSLNMQWRISRKFYVLVKNEGGGTWWCVLEATKLWTKGWVCFEPMTIEKISKYGKRQHHMEEKKYLIHMRINKVLIECQSNSRMTKHWHCSIWGAPKITWTLKHHVPHTLYIALIQHIDMESSTIWWYILVRILFWMNFLDWTRLCKVIFP
jgi:hypothetical protein